MKTPLKKRKAAKKKNSVSQNKSRKASSRRKTAIKVKKTAKTSSKRLKGTTTKSKKSLKFKKSKSPSRAKKKGPSKKAKSHKKKPLKQTKASVKQITAAKTKAKASVKPTKKAKAPVKKPKSATKTKGAVIQTRATAHPSKAPLKKHIAASKTFFSSFSRPNAQKVSHKPDDIKLNWAEKELQTIEARKLEKSLIFRDTEGRDYCLFEDCDFPAVSGEYCRLHYIGRWNYIKMREKILSSGFIEKTIQQLLKKTVPDCINYIISDFRSEKSFLAGIKPLLEELDTFDEDILFATEALPQDK